MSIRRISLEVPSSLTTLRRDRHLTLVIESESAFARSSTLPEIRGSPAEMLFLISSNAACVSMIDVIPPWYKIEHAKPHIFRNG